MASTAIKKVNHINQVLNFKYYIQRILATKTNGHQIMAATDRFVYIQIS